MMNLRYPLHYFRRPKKELPRRSLTSLTTVGLDAADAISLAPLTTITAVVVTRNPVPSIFRSLIDPLHTAGLAVVIIDNSSENISLLSTRSDLLVFSTGGNCGIPGPLSILLSLLKESPVEWIWYFDQDSEIDDATARTMIDRLANTTPPNVAQLSPIYADKNSGGGYSAARLSRRPLTPIGSGSAYRTSACVHAGGFASELPLDLWDFEASLRLQKAGFSVIVAEEIRILHEVGNRVSHEFQRISLLEDGHPPWRYELKARATRLIIARYVTVYPEWCLRHLVARCLEIAVSAAYRRDRLEIIRSVLKGVFRRNIIVLPGDHA